MRIVCALAFAALLAPQSAAQQWAVTVDHASCDARHGNWDYCEVRETTLPATSKTLTIDGGTNGGIRVNGWNGSEISVEATVRLHRRDRQSDRRSFASEIEVRTDGDEIRAVGPAEGRDWSVSYRVQVPRFSDLSLRTHNGGISISDVEGRIEFDATNGGVHLDALAGDVRGSTRNGGMKVTLYGDEWIGEGLDVKTSNGGVKLRIPEDYSAELETGTTNGRVRIDFPILVQGSLNKRIRTTLGRGGAPVRVMTTNGGVVVGRN